MQAVVSGAGSGARAPVWDVAGAALRWVDGTSVHRLDPRTGEHRADPAPGPVDAVRPRVGGGLVLVLRDGVALVDRGGARTWLLYWARDGVVGGGAAVDPAGRLWAASLTAGGGWLVRLDADGTPTVVLDGPAAAGALAWTPDPARVLQLDPAGTVDLVDVDGSGLGARRRLCAVDDEPRGLAVAADGAFWVAVDDGVHRHGGDGTHEQTVAVPGGGVTGCAFGGPLLQDLYVTAAGGLLVLPGAGDGLPTPAFAG